MSTPKSQYLLLFRNANWHRELSPDEIQEIMGRTNAWFERMTKDGIMKAGQPLESEGRSVSFKNGAVADGPFAETKELVAGYWLWEVKSMEDAVEWVKRCPNPMPEDSEIEIRGMISPEDFGEAFTPEHQATYAEMLKKSQE